MLLSSSSILVSQPLLLDITQRRFLTGIRFAAESAELFYSILCERLEAWNPIAGPPPTDEDHLKVFGSVWAFIDNSRRFHRLLWKIPELNKLPKLSGFVEGWSATLRSVRDAMQHPDADYINEMKENYVYGSLYWIDSRRRITDNIISAHLVNAGPQSNYKLKGIKYPIDIPIDSKDGVHSIIISTAGAAVEIDRLMKDIKETLYHIEDHLRTFLDQLTKLAATDNKRRARLALRAQRDTFYRLDLSPQLGSPQA